MIVYPMKRIVRAIGTAGLAMLVAGAGGTGTGWSIDTDGDGRYSLAELRAFYPGLSEPVFVRIDLDGDGRVSPAEFRAAQDDGLLILASGH